MTNNAPDYFEPLIGWRRWNVTDDRLEAVSIGTQWIPYEPMLGTHEDSYSWIRTNKQRQGLFCECGMCGVYAYRFEKEARDSWCGIEPSVVGRVALWGRVVIHERGYRAQYAYPLELLYAEGCDGSAVAKAYGIPYNEDLSWKLEPRNESWWLNPWWPLSPPATWNWFPFTSPNRWSSRYLLRPDEHELIIRPEIKDPLDLELPNLPAGMVPPKVDLPTRYQLASGVWVHDDRIAEPEDDYRWVPLRFNTYLGVDLGE